MNDFKEKLSSASKSIQSIDAIIADLTAYRDASTATIAKYLRIDEGGIDLDLDAIRATLTRPYTILPINEHEAWLIHWRGVKMPIFGWVVAQEPAFIKAKVSRSMDLLTPLPQYLKDEMGWKAPEHKAVVDGTRTGIALTEGDEAAFKRKYGQHLGGKQADGTFKIKGGDAWIKLVAALVRDGILPYTPQPVAEENWRSAYWSNHATLPDLLQDIINKKQAQAGEDYIFGAVEEFRAKGAVLVNYPPGSGKTLTACAVLNYFRGRVLILGDSTMLMDQWRERVKTLVDNPEVDITFSTYQGAAKYLNEAWDLIIPDEAQRLPANTFSKLAFAKTKYRLGLTGTAWREDERQHLIVALSGFPVAIRWASLIASGALRRPRIVVATVPSDSAKTAYVKSLLAKRKGRTIIFCDWIEQGQALADALDVPFIHGATARKLEKIQESDVCVVSRIADRGISLPDVRLVIEVAGAGSAREQFAQRVGRLLHGSFEGEFVTVFTPEEAMKYRGRVFGVEAELAGEVDIEFVTIGDVKEVAARVSVKREAGPAPRKATPTRDIARSTDAPHDEIDDAFALPAISAKISQVKKSVGGRTADYVPRVLRYCWNAALSPKEIAEGLGINAIATLARMKAACKACEAIGLMTVDASGRYRVHADEIQRLRVLSGLKR